MASNRFRKSTIVRLQQQGLHLVFGLLERVAPTLGGRLAYRLWLRVPRVRPAGPVPSGGEDFTVRSQGSTIRGHSWGDGPVVYLVHGWGGRGSQFGAIAEPLIRAGFRVVIFDGPSHGDSEPGPSGPGRSHGVELGRALDDVVARFGPAHAVVAHSLGAVATLLAWQYGWLGAERLLLLAPMDRLTTALDFLVRTLGAGPKTAEAICAHIREVIGIDVEDIDLAKMITQLPPMPIKIMHEVGDRVTSYPSSLTLSETRDDIELITLHGLGHQRMLKDPGVVSGVASFVRQDQPRDDWDPGEEAGMAATA